MRSIMKRCAAAVLAATVSLTGVAPAQAISLPSAPVTVTSDVTRVDHRHGTYYRYERYERHERGYGSRHHRYERHGYYNGHRGYRTKRPGYRYHDGYWFPLAAFAAGAIIGGAIAAQPAPPPRARAGINPRHYAWCANRYRSYHRASNTFQPYHGPRQQCYSPYY